MRIDHHASTITQPHFMPQLAAGDDHSANEWDAPTSTIVLSDDDEDEATGAEAGDVDDFDEDDFDDEFDDDFEEELEDEYDLADLEEVDDAELPDDDVALPIGGDFVDEDAEPDEPLLPDDPAIPAEEEKPKGKGKAKGKGKSKSKGDDDDLDDE